MDFSKNELSAVKNFIYGIADDHLVLGHRNSEWTGLGPILEEDIAFSSMAQDKLGQAQALYELLFKMGENAPDTLAFTRKVNEMKCCHLVEYPIGEYDFSLMRHFLFDEAAQIRFEILESSSFGEIGKLAKKFRGEIRYHVMHAETWIMQLSRSNEETRKRMQDRLNEIYVLALGIFEPAEFEDMLINMKIFPGEKILKEIWIERIDNKLKNCGLEIPAISREDISYGGRQGKHTVYLKPLLEEMTEVYSIDPVAEW